MGVKQDNGLLDAEKYLDVCIEKHHANYVLDTTAVYCLWCRQLLMSSCCGELIYGFFRNKVMLKLVHIRHITQQ